MSDVVFVIRNQLGQYWTRAQEWVDGREPQRLLKHRHRDEALNQLVELSARDIELRGEVLGTETDARGEPVIEPSAHLTPTLAEKAAAAAANEAEAGATGATTDAAASGADDGKSDAPSEPIGTAAVSQAG
jgi:hypothetical protein